MFTGIIEKMATVVELEPCQGGMRLTVDTDWHDIAVGESICVNGTCLTALTFEAKAKFDLSPETLSKTNFNQVKPGDAVNLERALAANGRFSGHYVTGHVDTQAKLLAKNSSGEFVSLLFGEFADKEALLYIIAKGSITLNGISLTINQVEAGGIEIMVVPHTGKHTNLSCLAIGAQVNVEFDYLARLVAHQVKSIQKGVVAV